MASVNIAPKLNIEPAVTEGDKAWQADYDKTVANEMAGILKELGVDADAEADAELGPEEAAQVQAATEDIIRNGIGDPAGHLPRPEKDEDERQEMPDPLVPVAPAAKAPRDPEEAKKQSERASTAMLRLLDKEREVTEGREALRREREEWEGQRTQASANSVDLDTIKSALRNDPVGVFRALGLAPQDALPVLVAAQMGDKAPPEIRAAAERAQERAEREDLKNQIAGRDRAEAARAEYGRVADGARTFVKDQAPKFARAPVVAELASGDPDLVHEYLMEEIVRDASGRQHRDPNGRPMSYEAAAERVESRLARIAKVLRKTPGTNDTAAQLARPAEQKKTESPGVTPRKLSTKARPEGRTWVDQQREDEVEAALREARGIERRLRSQGR